MDELEREDEELGTDEDAGDIDDVLSPGKKKPKEVEEDSLDNLAEEEAEVLPEDAFEDSEPEDLW